MGVRAESVRLESIATAFNQVIALKVGERVDLEVEGATFATWHPKNLLTGYSWDALAVGCLLGKRPPRSILVLGLGGGTVTRQLRRLVPDARLVGVEIDKDVIRLAQKHMGLDEQRVEVHIGDAYEFLAKTTDRFDAIIDDLFLTGPDDVVRTRVPAGETLALLRSRLNDDGVLVANLITDDGTHKTVQRSARAAFLEAFASVRVVKPPRGLNEILVGGTETRPRSALAGYSAAFAEPHDRQRLVEITVQLLRRPAERPA